MMLRTFVQKAGCAMATGVLFLQERVTTIPLGPTFVNLVRGLLFRVRPETCENHITRLGDDHSLACGMNIDAAAAGTNRKLA